MEAGPKSIYFPPEVWTAIKHDYLGVYDEYPVNFNRKIPLLVLKQVSTAFHDLTVKKYKEMTKFDINRRLFNGFREGKFYTRLMYHDSSKMFAVNKREAMKILFKHCPKQGKFRLDDRFQIGQNITFEQNIYLMRMHCMTFVYRARIVDIAPDRSFYRIDQTIDDEDVTMRRCFRSEKQKMRIVDEQPKEETGENRECLGIV